MKLLCGKLLVVIHGMTENGQFVSLTAPSEARTTNATSFASPNSLGAFGINNNRTAGLSMSPLWAVYWLHIKGLWTLKSTEFKQFPLIAIWDQQHVEFVHAAFSFSYWKGQHSLCLSETLQLKGNLSAVSKTCCFCFCSLLSENTFYNPLFCCIRFAPFLFFLHRLFHFVFLRSNWNKLNFRAVSALPQKFSPLI